MPANKPKLNGFEFLECLGCGVFGQVWKPRNVTFNTFRAIKIVPHEWQRWLERWGEEFVEPATLAPNQEARGMELVGLAPGRPPQGDWRALVIPLAHREA